MCGEPEELLVFLLDAAGPVASLSEPLGGDGEEDGFTLEPPLKIPRCRIFHECL